MARTPDLVGQRSSSSLTPSLSASGQPAKAATPGKSGHSSAESGTPSPSLSGAASPFALGHPLNSSVPAVSGHRSLLSGIPSPSESFGPKTNPKATMCWKCSLSILNDESSSLSKSCLYCDLTFILIF